MFNFFKIFFIKKRKEAIEIIKKHLEWERNLIRKFFSQKFKFPNLKQLKYLPYLLSKEEKRNIFFLLILLIISSGIFFLRIYLKLPLLPAPGGEYKEGILGQPKVINPLFSSLNNPDSDLTKLIFSSLVKWQNGKIIPDLAEKWKKDKEKKVYTFYLKKNVFFHDGKELTAEDVIFTIEAIQDKKINSPLRKSLINLKVKKIDNYTVQFLLEKPLAHFENFLTFGILPKHLWEKIPKENFISSQQNLSPVGTGPFKFKKLLREDKKIKKIILERNKKYYLKPPYLEKLNLIFFENSEELIDALRTKKIDGFAYLRKNQEIENVPKIINSYQIPSSYYTAIFLNQKSEIISSKRIREALALSLNKEEILKKVSNGKSIETAIVNPYFILRNRKYEYLPEKAKKILKEEGWIKKDGLLKKKEKILEINLVTINTLRHKEIGEIIKKNWEDLGIKINLEILEKENFEKRVKEKKYDALLYSVIEGYDPDPFSLWHSSQIEEGLNFSCFKDIKLDALIEKIRITLDEEEKKKYYFQFQETIFKEIGAIFLYQLNFDYFQDKKIKGFSASYLPYISDRFANIENWYIFSKRGVKK